MTTLEKQNLLGATLRLKDARTGATYTAKVWDVKEVYGKLRVAVVDGVWFEPSQAELDSVGDTGGAAAEGLPGVKRRC